MDERIEFLNSLEENKIPFREEGDKVVIGEGHGNLLLHIPSGVIPSRMIFVNRGWIWTNFLFEDCLKIGSDVEFRNSDQVFLREVRSLGERVVFANAGTVEMNSLRSIPKSTVISDFSQFQCPMVIDYWTETFVTKTCRGMIIFISRQLNRQVALEKMVSIGLFDND
jgi:hypothetical protein